MRMRGAVVFILLSVSISVAQLHVSRSVVYDQVAMTLSDAANYFSAARGFKRDAADSMQAGVQSASNLARLLRKAEADPSLAMSDGEWEGLRRRACDGILNAPTYSYLGFMNKFARELHHSDVDSTFVVGHNRDHQLAVVEYPGLKNGGFLYVRRYWEDRLKLVEMAACDLPREDQHELGYAAPSLEDYLAAKGLRTTGKRDRWGNRLVAPVEQAKQ